MKKRPRSSEDTRRRLVDAAIRLMLRQGYASTSVDGICEESGLTKGAFFHHFANKEALACAAVAAWGAMGSGLYAQAWDDESRDPLERIHLLLEIMASFTESPDEPCVCIVGMLSQELSETHPPIRAACERELVHWNAKVAGLLAAAKARHGCAADFDPEEAAWFLNSLWHGSMLVGKTCSDPERIRANLRLARRFVDGLFAAPQPLPA